MKKVLLIGGVLFLYTGAYAQLTESFADGDFTSGAHIWAGTTSTWQVVTSSDVAAGATNSFTLRLDGAPGSTATEYLSTQLSGSWGLGQTWGFWMGRRNQEATNTNRSFVWLYASESNVTSATVDGYRISFGDDTGNDEIFLECVTNGTPTTVIQSSGNVPNDLVDIGFLVRVTRSSTGDWNLYTSTLPTTDGTGAIATANTNIANISIAQGSATNTTYTNFTNGYISIAASHTNNSHARACAEFDQLLLSLDDNALLPVKFGTITGYEKQSGIQIDWTVYFEDNLSHYEIERSTDGRTFTTEGSVTARNSVNETKYSWFDTNPLAAVNFYRLKSIDMDSKTGYSSIVKVNLNKSVKEISLYPNPVINGHISFQSSGLVKGNYTVKIFNGSGQQVYTLRFNHTGGAINQTFQLPAGVRSGMYTLQLDSDAGKVMSKPFLNL